MGPRALERTIFAVASAFFALLLLYPLWSILLHSFTPEGRDPFAYFRLLLSSPLFFENLFNSINLAILSTGIAAVFGVCAALVLTRYDIPGRAFFKTALLLPMIVPPFVGAIGIRKLFSRFGPANLLLMDCGIISEPIDWLGAGGLLGIAVVQALHLYPILFLNLSAALSRLDPSYEDAAAGLGASAATRMRRILLPQIAPSLLAGAIIVFTWSLIDLGTPLVFEFRPLLAVRIFEQADEITSNPLGYTLVTTMALLCAALFLGSRALSGRADLTAGTKGSLGAPLLRPRRVARYSASLGMALFLCIAAIPHLGIALVSVAPKWFMTVLPEEWSLSAYAALPSHPLTSSSIRNSLLLSAGSTTIDIVIGIGIAWLLARGTIRGRRILDILTMAPLALPGVVIAFGYLGAFIGTPLDPRRNPIPLLIFGYALRRLPFMVRAVEAGLRQCSPALEEAAALLGARPLVVLRRIVAPLLAPHLLAGAILCFCFAMLEVSESLILATEERFFPITKAMYGLLGRPDGPMIASALGMVSMAVIIGSLLLAKRISGGSLGELLRG